MRVDNIKIPFEKTKNKRSFKSSFSKKVLVIGIPIRNKVIRRIIIKKAICSPSLLIVCFKV